MINCGAIILDNLNVNSTLLLNGQRKQAWTIK